MGLEFDDRNHRLGAVCQPGRGTWFRVWAPRPRSIELVLEGDSPAAEATVPLERDGEGYACHFAPGVTPGARYLYRLTNARGEVSLRPDPASRYQPEGVHSASQVTLARGPSHFAGPSWRDYIFYELHVGTFCSEGSFDAVARGLERLQRLGISALELMPVAQFPGTRNWGYDGAYPFAAQNSYGGPDRLHALVEALHARGMAAVLDVVYNHLGPEGNYLAEFGPYFTDRYSTPWGKALNFDGADSGPVRRYFLENALYWLDEMGFDALRLDAIHGIVDTSACPFLAELADTVAALAEHRGRNLYLVAESDLNDVRVLRPTVTGGFGTTAQWSDDLHHALHARLSGERQGYYADFGSTAALATALNDNYVFSGQYSHYRRRRHGNSARGFEARRFVVCAQNHDQVGNRAGGDRLAATLPLAALQLAAGLILLAPQTPLLFMGEEFGARTPFPYFVSHGDPELAAAVRRGRQAEFAAFRWQGTVPDPQAEATFLAAVLQPPAGELAAQADRLEHWYRRLISLRRELLAGEAPATVAAWSCEQSSVLTWQPARGCFVVAHPGPDLVSAALPWPDGEWQKRLDLAAWSREQATDRDPEREATVLGGTLHHQELEPYALRVYQRVSGATPPST